MGDKGMKTREEIQQEILEILRGRKSPKIMRDELDEYHAGDLAAALDQITIEERERFYRLESDEDLAEVLEHCDEADKYLEEMSLHRAASVLAKMEPDVAVDLMKETDSVKKKEWLELMDAESRSRLQSLASFDEDLIASRMTTNFVWLYSNMTVREGMKSLVEQAEEHDNISVLYVLDPQGVFYGAINLKDLIIARRDTELSDIIMTQFPYVYADERIEDCIWIIRDYSEESIPVLSSDNHILGAITSQEIAEVVGDEMGEDYAKLAGLSAEEDLNEPLQQSVKKRLPWLILLLGLGMVVSTVVGLFEGVVARLTIVMAFQSLILDMAGNVGTRPDGRSAHAETKAEADSQRGQCRNTERCGPRRARLCRCRCLHRVLQRHADSLRLCDFRLYRHLPRRRNADLESGRHCRPDFLQAHSCRPGSGFRSVDYDHHRLGRCRDLLRSCVAPPAGVYASLNIR